MITICKPTNELQRQWRQQLAVHCNPRTVADRRGFVAMTFLDQASSTSDLVEIDNLLVVVVYEDESRRNDSSPLRFAGYRVSRVAQGVRWGGADNCPLFKDLTLAPQRRARGPRMDRGKHELLSLALKLDRRLSRAARHPAAPWPELRLPVLWAGFRPRHSAALRGEGPEFEQACREQGKAPADLFRATARQIDGLVAYPMDWINEQLDPAVAVFADVTLAMRRQVCRIGSLSEGLIGYQGAASFDFYSSQYRKVIGPYRPRAHSSRKKDRTVRFSPTATSDRQPVGSVA
jgi:hypothetical protein